MSNIKRRTMSALLVLSLVFTMFAVNTVPTHAATKTLKLKASASGQTQAVLTWNKISKPYSGYAVFRDGRVVKYFGKGTTKFTDSGLASGSVHSYQIKSYKKTKQYYNSKKKKWQTSKPKASQWKGKQTRYVYSYKTKSNVVSIRTAYAYYTITWKNWNGTTLATTSIRQGLTPSYSGTPTRPNDNNYAYNFIGWSPSITAASGNKTYTAQYKAISLYTIKWMNYDGTVLRTDKVKSGVVPKYNGSTPTRPADTDNTYTFKGWSPSVVAANGNATYTAQFNVVPKPLYSITWNNWNGTSLGTDAVRAGVTPSYTGNKPTRTADTNYIYEFTGWSPTIVPANDHAVYTAQFKQIRRYTIIWKNWDGTELRTDKIREGSKPVYPGIPTRPADDNNVYNFTGWNPVVVSANSDAIYTAQYTAVPKNTDFTITWKNYDGSELQTSTVSAGNVPEYTGVTPTKPEDDDAVYEFNGWTPSVVAATSNTSYTAKFKTYSKYTITWKNYDGSTLATARVKVGEMPVYSGSTPTKPETDKYTYTFTGWTPSVAVVSGNATYEATFHAVAKPEPTEFNYEIHLINEPYGHGGKIAFYLDTNNPDIWDYDVGILNANGQAKKFNGGTIESMNYADVNSSLRSKIWVGSPECTGNCTLVIYEYDESTSSDKIVYSKQIYVKDYYAEEQVWMQSVIDQVTTSSMTNKEKMHNICNYLRQSFTYSWNDGWDGTGYINFITETSVPYWITKQTNSAGSPAFLVKFGDILGYSLHNCYADYASGTPEWENFHMCAYSAEDNTYFQCCPDLETGTIDPNSITMFNPNTYQFWGE